MFLSWFAIFWSLKISHSWNLCVKTVSMQCYCLLHIFVVNQFIKDLSICGFFRCVNLPDDVTIRPQSGTDDTCLHYQGFICKCASLRLYMMYSLLLQILSILRNSIMNLNSPSNNISQEQSAWKPSLTHGIIGVGKKAFWTKWNDKSSE